ncbi:putative RNA methyltransferase [Endozoicomonas arenosclerae]|uniref:putative RNA methyltransferase n=1 Tax=Endozoicomonas arenosclerae TaxID=1633495 RepID=UPI000785376C|nr:methyltransferase domain-containing protein [Endozoicomonas arenosclerae]
MTLTLRCPVCHEPLAQSLHTSGTGLGCSQNHQFDRARQGYFNLLPGHKKRSKNPGDDKTMVQARTRFLDKGYYQPVANALVSTLTRLSEASDEPLSILDAGCGEGFYTEQLQQSFPEAAVAGIDISKPAIMACCKRTQAIQWLVASVNDIPVKDQGLNVIVSVFSRCDWKEFARLLKPGEQVLVLAPGEQHLLALRQEIYETVRPYPVDKLLEQLPEDFSLSETLPVQGEMLLNTTEDILDLLAMTPHYWHVKPSQKEKLASLSTLKCSFDMKLYVIQRA